MLLEKQSYWFCGHPMSPVFPWGETFGVAILAEVRGAEEKDHVTVHTRLPGHLFKPPLIAELCAHPTDRPTEKIKVECAYAWGAAVSTAGGSAYQMLVCAERLNFALLPTLTYISHQQCSSFRWLKAAPCGFGIKIYHVGVDNFFFNALSSDLVEN